LHTFAGFKVAKGDVKPKHPLVEIERKKKKEGRKITVGG